MIISPLKVWVQNILPVVYDDSLSYLEIVAKINAKTNEIISQTNENTHAIETLAGIIAELGDIDELKALLEEVKTIVEDLYTTDEPMMDGEASAGSADHAARSDHVHPSDTSKANKDLGINNSTANQYVKILAVDNNGKPTAFGSGTPSGGGAGLSDNNPVMNGTANAGSGNEASRYDHVHPSDTSKANKDLGINNSTANQYVKILAVDNNGKPTAFGSGTPSGGTELSDNNPVMNGTPSAGSGTKASRDDHVHPKDTSKLDTNGDGSNVTTAFTVASSRTNIATGEKLSVLFGKIAKWFTDLGTAAFRAATSNIINGSSDLIESGAVFTALKNKVENNEIGIVINGAIPSMAVYAGQYVIVHNSTITGITDGLYTAVNALSPSTAVTAADLTAVNIGGLNQQKNIITVSSISGESGISFEEIYIYKQMDICCASFSINVSSAKNAYSKIGTIPESIRPKGVINIAGCTGTGTIYPVYILGDGSVWCRTALNSGLFIYCCAAYMT